MTRSDRSEGSCGGKEEEGLWQVNGRSHLKMKKNRLPGQASLSLSSASFTMRHANTPAWTEKWAKRGERAAALAKYSQDTTNT